MLPEVCVHGAFPSWMMRVFVLLTSVGVLPVAAHTQVIYTGAQPSVHFPAVAVNSKGAAQSLGFKIKAGTVVTQISVLSQGVAGRDFVEASSSTCVAKQYVVDTNCIVNVTFQPVVPGWRMGGVVFFESQDGGEAIVPLYGLGEGAQVGYFPPSVSVLTSTADPTWSPTAIATDPNGTVYVNDYSSGQIVTFAPDGKQGVAFSGPGGIDQFAFDAAGNVYAVFTNFGSFPPAGGVVKYPIQGSGYTVIGNTINPTSVAIDGSGNVYIGDAGSIPNGPQGPAQLIKVTPQGVQTVIFGGLTAANQYLLYPAVDAAGNIYVIDPSAQIYQYSQDAKGNYVQSAFYLATGLKNAQFVKLDGGGNFYTTAQCASCGNSNWMLVELTRSGQQKTLYQPSGTGAVLLDAYFPINVDAFGNIYSLGGTDPSFSTRNLVRLGRNAPEKLTFPTVTRGGTTDNADGAQKITLQNTGNSNLSVVELTYPVDFPEGPGDANACTRTTVLLDKTCDINVDFAPVTVKGTQTSIPLSENVGFYSNSLNQLPNPEAEIPVAGVESKLAPKTTLSSSSPRSGVGMVVAYTATVSGTGGTPTGYVAFSDGSLHATLPLSAGKAVYKTNVLPAGSYTFTATFSGNADYAAGSAPPIKQIVVKNTTQVTLSTSANPARKGTSVTFKAAVAKVGQAPIPTGTVQFFAGGTRFASTSLSGGVATATISTLAEGVDSITAVYSGDAAYLTNTSNTVKETIQP